MRKTKWLIFGTYHPPSQRDEFYFDSIGRALDVYNSCYDKILLAGDFNAEDHETVLKTFLQLYDLKNIVKDKTCFKSLYSPTCIDLFLTNSDKSFIHTKILSIGVSDCHKMILTLLKTTFKKVKPKEVSYRCYKNFEKDKFRSDLKQRLRTGDCKSYSNFEDIFLNCLNRHVPLKKRVIRANEVPYMTKALRKAIATRSRLENRYYRNKTANSKTAYKKQKNYVSRLYKKERKKYYTNLDTKHITDNKRFWFTMKPLFSDKGAGTSKITLVEDDKIISEDQDVANTLNSFFANAVPSLGLYIPEEHIMETTGVTDPIEAIILKYSRHPSIQMITANVGKSTFRFNNVQLSDIEQELGKLDSTKGCKSNSIPAYHL